MCVCARACVFSGLYTFVAEWFVLVNRQWPVPFDAALHFSREAMLAAFVAVWLHRWLREADRVFASHLHVIYGWRQWLLIRGVPLYCTIVLPQAITVGATGRSA
jgi:hypothetical protein